MTSGLSETSYSAAISSVVTTPDLHATHTIRSREVKSRKLTFRKEVAKIMVS